MQSSASELAVQSGTRTTDIQKNISSSSRKSTSIHKTERCRPRSCTSTESSLSLQESAYELEELFQKELMNRPNPKWSWSNQNSTNTSTNDDNMNSSSSSSQRTQDILQQWLIAHSPTTSSQKASLADVHHAATVLLNPNGGEEDHSTKPDDDYGETVSIHSNGGDSLLSSNSFSAHGSATSNKCDDCSSIPGLVRKERSLLLNTQPQQLSSLQHGQQSKRHDDDDDDDDVESSYSQRSKRRRKRPISPASVRFLPKDITFWNHYMVEGEEEKVQEIKEEDERIDFDFNPETTANTKSYLLVTSREIGFWLISLTVNLLSQQNRCVEALTLCSEAISILNHHIHQQERQTTTTTSIHTANGTTLKSTSTCTLRPLLKQLQESQSKLASRSVKSVHKSVVETHSPERVHRVKKLRKNMETKGMLMNLMLREQQVSTARKSRPNTPASLTRNSSNASTISSVSSHGLEEVLEEEEEDATVEEQKQETQMPSSPGVERNLLIVLEGSKEEEEFVMDTNTIGSMTAPTTTTRKKKISHVLYPHLLYHPLVT